jgi:signal transduction histidine kinase
MLELIEVDAANVSEVDLEPFTAAAVVALTNARLYEQAHVSATLAERNRVARELHDTIAQSLTALRLQLEAATRAWSTHPERAYQRLQRAHELSQSTLDDVRRSVWDLGSSLVDGHALTEALTQQLTAFGARTTLHVSYTHNGPSPEFDHGTATQLVRIVGEALANIEKHAQATTVHATSVATPQSFTLTIIDNGVGFDPTQVAPTDQSGFGLTSLQERARLVGGTLQVSSALNVGTTITVALPVQQGGLM